VSGLRFLCQHSYFVIYLRIVYLLAKHAFHNNYQNTWNGEGAADGVYYWTLELEDGEGTQMQGTVTIMSK